MAKHLAPSEIFLTKSSRGQQSANGTHDVGHNLQEEALNSEPKLNIVGTRQIEVGECTIVPVALAMDFADGGAVNFS